MSTFTRTFTRTVYLYAKARSYSDGIEFCVSDHGTLAQWPKTVFRQQIDTMRARAERLYPDDEYLQNEWLRAVRVVRSTSAGWLLDRRQGRKS